MNAALSRAAAAAGGGTDLAAWITPSRTALLIIDMQVDFASPEGLLGRWGADLSAVPAALGAAQRLALAARTAGAAVIFVALQTSEAMDSAAWSERMRRRGAGSDAALCRVGERGAEFVGPTPAPDELVIPKLRYSGFFGTPLDATLRAQAIDTLVICGLTTECCVDCTVRDAFHLDYHVFVVSDACAAYESDLHQGALKSLDLNCAILVETDQVVAAWSDAI